MRWSFLLIIFILTISGCRKESPDKRTEAFWFTSVCSNNGYCDYYCSTEQPVVDPDPARKCVKVEGKFTACGTKIGVVKYDDGTKMSELSCDNRPWR